jgi:hypothetical protein
LCGTRISECCLPRGQSGDVDFRLHAPPPLDDCLRGRDDDPELEALSKEEWRMPPFEWSMAKARFAVIFGERFVRSMAA